MTQRLRRRKTTSLFFRILMGIMLPLLILLVFFSVLLIQREMSIQQKYYVLEGKNTVKQIETEFNKLDIESTLDYPPLLQDKVSMLKKMFRTDDFKIDIIDPLKEISLLDSNQGHLSTKELRNVSNSLSMKREIDAPLIIADAFHQKLYSYITIYTTTSKRIIVVATEKPLLNLKEALVHTTATLLAAAFFVIAIGYIIAMILSVRIIKPVKDINRACREILSGKLGFHVQVKTGDELEVMATNFNQMSLSLLTMQRHAEDSNPLTQLPGNREITAELVRRIEEHQKFVFFHVDIDHFKAYNDYYGLARGDDVLRRCGKMLTEVVNDLKKEGSFVGHQGGDDFILILNLDKAKEIGEEVCKRFDAFLIDFYHKEDLERGYFLGEDPRSEEKEIKRQAIMSVSLAGITNANAEVSSYREILENAVRVKKKVKKIPYSKYLIEDVSSDVTYLS